MSEVLEQLDEKQTDVIDPEQEQTNVQEAEVAPEHKPVELLQEELQDKNWKAARARMDSDAREKALLKHRADLLEQELEFLRRSVKQPEPEKSEEEEEFLTDSERKLYREIKGLKEQMQQNKAKESDYVIDRLRARYADFDEVMSPDNITYLKTNNAALAKALASLKDDPYEQGIAAYDALKKTEWYQQRHTMQDKAKLEQNIKKPLSVQAVRKQGALSEANTFANGLTPELKKQLQREMAEARKGA